MARKKLLIMKRAVLLASLALGLTGTGAEATLLTFDTSAISGGDYLLEFQLTDGSGGTSGDKSSTVTLTNFYFGGGTSSEVAAEGFGGVTGALKSGLTLTDTEFFNYSIWNFTAGSSLSFDAVMSLNGGSDVPDRFSFFIQSADGNYTQIDGLSYSAESSAAPVPEPSTLILLAGGLAGGLLARKLRKTDL